MRDVGRGRKLCALGRPAGQVSAGAVDVAPIARLARDTGLITDGRKVKTFYSKKYGIGHVRFTHRSGNIIHTSTKVDHAVRYHAMHDNKYLSYFRGHEAMSVRLYRVGHGPSTEGPS